MRALVATLAALVVLMTTAVGAQADYGAGEADGGADLVSADYDRLEQGDDSTVYAAVSADGRYVVIQTRARNFFADDDPDPAGQYRAGGVFRFEIASQNLEKVADGDLFDEDTNDFLRRGASNPSVSADGRYVAFATAEPLIAADLNDNADIYVRDMNVAEGGAGAYDLVSARDGSDVPATYGQPAVPNPGSNPGSDLTRGVAISGDGRYVAFRTDVASNLPASGAVDTPSRQVLVRDRQANSTTLVTRNDPGGQPAGGAFGAAISADGTTVAWTGSNAAAQTRFLSGESTESSLNYYMWRRLADGPAAPTRRITGVSDPDDPACPSGQTTTFDSTSTGPCFGPLAAQEGQRSSIISQVPALSADGYTVAYLTGSGPRLAVTKGTGLDLFVTDMSPGITRKAGTTELTRAAASTDPATSSAISSLSMAPDGGHLVIATSRTNFTLPVLTPTGPSRTVPGTQELYAIDLEARTLDRVARSYLGDDINGDVQGGATISNGGETIAFTSFAGNLFFGDANQRADAFLASLQEDPPAVPPVVVPPFVAPTTEQSRLVVRAKRSGPGALLMQVEVPAAGGLKIVAKGRAGKPRSVRSLAKGTGRSQAAGVIEIPLRVVERYRSELQERGRLHARARLEFIYSAGGERISDTVGIAFKQRDKKGRKSGDKNSHN